MTDMNQQILFELQTITNLLENGRRTPAGMQPAMLQNTQAPQQAYLNAPQVVQHQPTPQQFVQQQPVQHQQAAQQAGAVTSDMILALVQPLAEHPVARPLMQQAMQAMGINALPDAKPEQYGELYNRFLGVKAHVEGAGQPMQQAMQQQPVQQQQFAQQPQYATQPVQAQYAPATQVQPQYIPQQQPQYQQAGII